MKTFNEKVKRMYKTNVKAGRGCIEGIHALDNGWVEYTDGTVLVQATGQTFLSSEVAVHKNLPGLCKPDVDYPKTAHLFINTEIKASIRLQKETLLKLLDMFENDDVMQLDIRGEHRVITVTSTNFKGLIMPCK